jgi:hypothetical protein
MSVDESMPNRQLDGTGSTDAAGDTGIVELPMTPAIAGLLHREIRTAFFSYAKVAGIFSGLFFAVGLWNADAGTLSFGAVVLLPFLLLWWVKTKPYRHDLSKNNYLRATGPAKVDARLVVRYGELGRDERKEWVLRTAGNAFHLTESQAVALMGLTSASVDYTAQSTILLEIRNRRGEALFRRPGGIIVDEPPTQID